MTEQSNFPHYETQNSTHTLTELQTAKIIS